MMGNHKKHKRMHELPIDTKNKKDIIISIHLPSLYPQGYAPMWQVFYCWGKE